MEQISHPRLEILILDIIRAQPPCTAEHIHRAVNRRMECSRILIGRTLWNLAGDGYVEIVRDTVRLLNLNISLRLTL